MKKRAWFYFSNPAAMLENLLKTDLKFVGIGLLIMITSLSFKSYRWKLFLKDIGVNIPFKTAFTSFMSGLFVSMLTPARTGEPVRGYILKKKVGSSFTQALPLILVERVIDLVVILIFSVAGIAMIGSMIASDASTLLVTGTGILVALLFTAILAIFKEKFGRTLLKIMIKIPFLRKLEEKIEYVLTNFYESSKKIRKRTLFYSSMISVIVWTLEGLLLLAIIMSLGYSVDPLIAIEIIAISQIIGLISSLPGGLGSIEAVMSLMLIPFIPEIALASTMVLLYRFTSFWPAMVIGAGALIHTMGFRFLKEKMS